MRTPRKKYLGKNQWMPHLCEDYPSENENICMVLKTADKLQGGKRNYIAKKLDITLPESLK